MVVVVLLLLELGPAGESGIEGNGSGMLSLAPVARRERDRDDDMAVGGTTGMVQIYVLRICKDVSKSDRGRRW